MRTRIERLYKQVPVFIRDLEGWLGPRDPEFEVGRIKPCLKNPHISCPRQSRIIDIYLTRGALEEADAMRAKWQLAHECLHLIDPHEVPTNVLEEGLATWYQYRVDPKFAERGSSWDEAAKLVTPFMGILPAAIMRIRKNLRLAIGDIPPDVLVQYCPEAERVAQKLTARFFS